MSNPFSFLSRFLAGPRQRKLHAECQGPARSEAERLKLKGNELFVRQRMADALGCYRRALEADPGYDDARWNMAIASLFLGDYRTGFEYFEARFVAGDPSHRDHLQGVMAMMAGKHLWHGERLHGKRLLVWTEQGFGDTLMFARFLSECKERGDCHLMVACEPELVRMMKLLPGVDSVISKDLPLPFDSFDFHCSLLSLPHLLGVVMESLPGQIPYFTVPEDIGRNWRSRTAALDGLKVGIVWAGGARLATDPLRSMGLNQFEPLARVRGVTLVSLQKGEPARQLAGSRFPVVDWMGECRDFLDTAGLLDGLDLIVSADTAVAHLAGALGKPVWLLNRFESEWRWMLGREDSAWYPSMRIFTQPALHDWDSVIAKAAQELAILAKSNSTHLLAT